MSSDHQRTQQITLHPNCALHTQELTRIATTVDDIHRRLFVDNGEPCMQSKVRRCTDITNGIVWVLGAVVVAVIGVVVEMIRK